MAKPPPKPRVGRPRRDPSGAQTKKTLNFTPAEIAFLEKTYGTVQAGVRALVAAAMGQ